MEFKIFKINWLKIVVVNLRKLYDSIHPSISVTKYGWDTTTIRGIVKEEKYFL